MGAWPLVVCALSLARAAAPADTRTTITQVNAEWLETFRRQLMRDNYDYQDPPRPPPSSRPAVRSLYVNNTADPSAQNRLYVTDAADQSAQNRLYVTTTNDQSAGNKLYDTKTEDQSAPNRLYVTDAADQSTRNRLYVTDSADQSTRNRLYVTKTEDQSAQQADGAVGRSADDIASQEFGISRRDLYNFRGSFPDIDLDNPRQAYIKSLYELEQQMQPVYVRPDSRDPRDPGDHHEHRDPSDSSDPSDHHKTDDFADSHGRDPYDPEEDHQSSDNGPRRLRKSRKRLWDEDNTHKPDRPRFIDQNGIRRYRVHTDINERHQNQFGDVRHKEWDIGTQFDDLHGAKETQEDEFEYGIESEVKPYRGEMQVDEIVPQLGGSTPKQSESREESDSRDVQYRESLRSRYVNGNPVAAGDYAQQFAARRDAALLADGLGSSNQPCDCHTDPQVLPGL